MSRATKITIGVVVVTLTLVGAAFGIYFIIHNRKVPPPPKWVCKTTGQNQGCIEVAPSDPLYKTANPSLDNLRASCFRSQCKNAKKCVTVYNWHGGDPTVHTSGDLCNEQCANATKFVCHTSATNSQGCIPSSKPVSAADITSGSVFPIATNPNAPGDKYDIALQMCMERDSKRKICQGGTNAYQKCADDTDCPVSTCIAKPGGCAEQEWFCPNKVGTAFYGTCQPFYTPMVEVPGADGPSAVTDKTASKKSSHGTGAGDTNIMATMCKDGVCESYKTAEECTPLCKYCGGGNAGASFGSTITDGTNFTCDCNAGYAGDDCGSCETGRGPLYPACGYRQVVPEVLNKAGANVCVSQDSGLATSGQPKCWQCGPGAAPYDSNAGWSACTNNSPWWAGGQGKCSTSGGVGTGTACHRNEDCTTAGEACYAEIPDNLAGDGWSYEYHTMTTSKSDYNHLVPPPGSSPNGAGLWGVAPYTLTGTNRICGEGGCNNWNAGQMPDTVSGPVVTTGTASYVQQAQMKGVTAGGGIVPTGTYINGYGVGPDYWSVMTAGTADAPSITGGFDKAPAAQYIGARGAPNTDLECPPNWHKSNGGCTTLV